MIASPIDTGLGVIIISTGIPVYFLFLHGDVNKRPKMLQKFSGCVTKFLQQLLVVIPPQKKPAVQQPPKESEMHEREPLKDTTGSVET